MDCETRLKYLEILYVGVLADTVGLLTREGILEKVVQKKRQEQLIAGKHKADQLGIVRPMEVFTKLYDIANCAKWEIIEEPNGFSAVTHGCKLNAFCKRLDTASPCNICCLDPMEGMIKGLSPDSKFMVKETLWDSDRCKVMVLERS